MSASVPDLDAALRQAESAAAHLGGRLFELDAEVERRSGEVGRLEGASAVAWKNARDQVSVMWAWFQALSEAVEAIASRRRAAGFHPRELDVLWSDLKSRTVDLAPESMALAQRCLPVEAFTGAPWPIDALVALMSTVIQGAAETIVALFAIRDMASQKLDELEASLAHSEAVTRDAGLDVPEELGTLRDQVRTLRQQLAGDPASIGLDCFSSLSASAARVAAEVEAAVASLRGIDEVLARIRAGHDAACHTLVRALEDLAEVKIKIAGADQRRGVAHADELATRLDQLDGRLDEALERAEAGDRAGAVCLAQGLESSAEGLRVAADALAHSAVAPLARRRELRGRLGAYRAKARGLGRAEDPALAELYSLAEYALYSAPCDLDEAERRLTAYQLGILSGGQAAAPETPDRLERRRA